MSSVTININAGDIETLEASGENRGGDGRDRDRDRQEIDNLRRELFQLQADHQKLGEDYDRLAADNDAMKRAVDESEYYGSLVRGARHALNAGIGNADPWEARFNWITSGELKVELYTGNLEKSKQVAHAMATALNLVQGH